MSRAMRGKGRRGKEKEERERRGRQVVRHGWSLLLTTLLLIRHLTMNDDSVARSELSHTLFFLLPAGH